MAQKGQLKLSESHKFLDDLFFVFKRTPWPRINSLLGCIHRGIYGFFPRTFHSGRTGTWCPYMGGCGKLAHGQQPSWGLNFVPPAPVLLTLEVLKWWERSQSRTFWSRNEKQDTLSSSGWHGWLTSTGILLEAYPTLI